MTWASSGALFLSNSEAATWISSITLPCSSLVLVVRSLSFRGGDMKAIYLLPLLFLAVFSSKASAGWKCSQSYMSATPKECASAGTKSSPESFITAYSKAADQFKTNANRVNYQAGVCSILSDTAASCSYSWTFYGTAMSNTVSIAKEAELNCPDTVESRGPNSPIIKSAGKSFVSWKEDSVTSDICHDSCSYLASSVTSTNCYFASGSTSTGFCNFVVGLNTSSPSCGADSGYTSPAVGDPLNPVVDPGDGGDDGTPPDPGDGGNTGGDNNGGNGDSGFDGELSFTNPGQLSADAVLDSEVNAVHYKAFVHSMQVDLNNSGFGQAMTEFKENIASANSGGVCPTADIAILGAIVSFDAHCALFASISPVLSTVFLAAWCLLALRVFLSA